MVKVIGTAGSTRYSYRDHVEIKPGIVHSQTYTAYQGSITNEGHAYIDKNFPNIDKIVTATVTSPATTAPAPAKH